jgi:hypothetical protein
LTLSSLYRQNLHTFFYRIQAESTGTGYLV